MKKLVVTKYFGPTNFRGSRIKANNLTDGGSVTLPYLHRLDGYDNHKTAAEGLLEGYKVTECLGDTSSGYYFLLEIA